MIVSSRKFLSISMATLILFASGCSWFGGGKKKDSAESDSLLSESDLNGNRGNIPSAEGEGMFRDVHFEFDSAQLSMEGQQNAEYNAQVLRDNAGLRVQLEGHCDERGTEEYNMALGARRASSVRNALAALGVSDSRLGTVSYGENIPLVQGSDESSWAKNRRVHFAALGSLK